MVLEQLSGRFPQIFRGSGLLQQGTHLTLQDREGKQCGARVLADWAAHMFCHGDRDGLGDSLVQVSKAWQTATLPFKLCLSGLGWGR